MSFSAPAALRRAVQLMYVGAGLSAANALVSLTLYDNVRAGIERHNRARPSGRMTRVEIDQAAHTTVTVLAMTAAVSVVVWIIMAVLNRRGRWWARIAATVLTLFCLLQTWSFLTRGHPTVLAGLLSVALAIVAVAATALLWRPENAAHFGQSVPEKSEESA